MRSLFRSRQETPAKENLEDKNAVRLKAGLRCASMVMLEGAIVNGKDLLVGAVAMRGDTILGDGGFSSDQLLGVPGAHAEPRVIESIEPEDREGLTIISTLEPCDDCQDLMAVSGVDLVAFSLPRIEVEDRHLVKRHDEYIFERASRLNLPFEVVMIDDPVMYNFNLRMLDHVRRDPVQEVVSIDRQAIRQDLASMPVSHPALMGAALSF